MSSMNIQDIGAVSPQHFRLRLAAWCFYSLGLGVVRIWLILPAQQYYQARVAE